ncbi:MAG TPA: DUF501 domain-containing protein [Motiliproteus sp.]
MTSEITPQQLEIIQQQLGRTPRGIVRIAHQNSDGVPVVLQMRSLVDDQPFPTLYWLCSQDLYQAIARIETGGWVKEIEAQLQTDEALRERYLQDQRGYVAQRWALMADADRTRIAELGFTELFEQYGIGGIRHWDKVRCLHMQYAHHLCGRNVIGERMDAEFGLDKVVIAR